MLNEMKSATGRETKLIAKIRLRLTLAVLLGLLTLAFANSQTGFIKNIYTELQKPVVNNNIIPGHKLSIDEQNEVLEHLLSGRIEKYESELDYRENKTGSVIIDTTGFGNGANVIYCGGSVDKAGYVLKGVKKRYYDNGIKNKWLNDTMHNWYVNPRIRIRQDLVYPLITGYNEENLHTKICRLEIINTEGKVIREVEYEGKHFLEKHPDNECKIYYSGSYMEGYGYLFEGTPGSKIIVTGKELNPDGITDLSNTKVDYRIYWYGYTDMWVDYIEVKNDVAGDLLTGKYDIIIEALKDINIKETINIKANPNQLLCFGYLRNKAYEKGISLR